MKNNFNVRLSHVWYDGPNVAIEVLEDNEWIPYGKSLLADSIDEWANENSVDMELDPDIHTPGLYYFDGIDMEKVDESKT